MRSSYLKYFRMVIALCVAVLCVLSYSGKFYGIKIFDLQLTPLIQRALVDFSIIVLALMIALIVITLLFGRVYCSTLCPLGLMQELMMIIFSPIRKLLKKRYMAFQKHYIIAYFIAVVCFGGIIGGTAAIIRHIDPYSIAGNAMSGSIYGLVFIGLLAVLVFFKNRFFCTNICPVGALLGILSKFSLFKIRLNKDSCAMCSLCAQKCPTGSIDYKNQKVNNETCIKCFNCLGRCKKGALSYGIKPTKTTEFDIERRRFLLKGSSFIVLALAFRSGLSYTGSVIQKIKTMLLPAGAGNPQDFANRCLNCNLCVKNCPMKIIKKADNEFPVVHLDYSDSFCDYNCHRCSEVCPSGAIKRISIQQKQHTKLGTALVNEEVCIRCGLCVHECPREIIHKEDGEFPHISETECIGCGACQNVCPVKAIKVVPVENQTYIV